MNQIVTVGRPSKLTNLELSTVIISAANVSTLINNNSGSLQSLKLHYIKGEGHSITRELPNLKVLQINHCDPAIENQIRGMASLMNQIVTVGRPSKLTNLELST